MLWPRLSKCYAAAALWRQQSDQQRGQRHVRPLEQDQPGLHRPHLRDPGRSPQPQVQPHSHQECEYIYIYSRHTEQLGKKKGISRPRLHLYICLYLHIRVGRLKKKYICTIFEIHHVKLDSVKFIKIIYQNFYFGPKRPKQTQKALTSIYCTKMSYST